MTTDKQTTEKAQTWTERTRARLMSTPEGRAALAEAEEREKRLIQQPCSAGNCVELIDPLTGENTGGWGPVGCACQDDDLRNPPADEAFRDGECAPLKGCGCMCHQPGGMAVKHMVACCNEPPSESSTSPASDGGQS